MKKFLFMCGAPRSGTSYLASIIGAHPNIAMGVERFKFHYSRRTLDSSLFEKDRFFDVRPEDTSLPQRIVLPHRDAMYGKYDTCEFVGDKYPDLIKRLPYLEQQLAHSTLLFVLRNPLDVGKSWEVRARDPRDHWPESNDYYAGVQYWLEAIHAATSAKARGTRIIVMDYDLLATGDADNAEMHLHTVLKEIGVPPGPEVFARLFETRQPAGRKRDGRLRCTEGELATAQAALRSPAWLGFLTAFKHDGWTTPTWATELPACTAADLCPLESAESAAAQPQSR